MSSHRTLEAMESELTSRCFEELRVLLQKIEVWWIREFEMTINPEFDGVDTQDATILPGPVMILDVMRKVALGQGEEAYVYYREFMKGKKTGQARSFKGKRTKLPARLRAL